MKKMLFLLILLIPIIITAKEKIVIENIKIESASSKNIEKTTASSNELNANFDLEFENVNDYIKYKITINNQTNKDYELVEATEFSKSDYIEYQFSYANEEKIIKKNDKTPIYVTIKYNKEYPQDNMVDGTFEEKNKMVINLGNEVNPATNDSILWISIAFATAIVLILLFRKKALNVSILLLVATPFIVIATEKLVINLNVAVTIQDNRVFYIYHSSDNTIDTINYYKNKDGYNIVKTVKDNYLYGGYYTDYHQKGSYKGDGVYVDDGIPFTGQENIRELRYVPFKSTEAYKGKENNGFKIKPTAGTTYYLKEIPTIFYSKVNFATIHVTSTSEINELAIMAPGVSGNYQVGFKNNENYYIGETMASFNVGIGQTTTKYDPYEMWGYENIQMSEHGMKEFTFPMSLDLYPYYITQDFVLVISKFGKRINLPTKYIYDISTEEIEVNDYTIEPWEEP